MRRAVIKIGDNLISYDGRDWIALEGERAEGLAKVMKFSEPLYAIKANTHPDFLYNMALEAARELGGEVIECDELAPGPPDRIY